MTYQATRPRVVGYGNTDIGRKSQNNETASRTKTVRRPAGMTAEEASRRREAARRAEAMRVRAEREEAYRIARMEQQRARHERELARIKAYERQVRLEQKQAKAEAKREARLEAKREEEALRRREIKLERRRAPMGIILGIVIAFVLLLGVVYSFSQVSESAAERSKMETHLSEIRAEAAKYKIEIEAKNNLGVIEEKAVNELNMVKEGSVQKKYITVSDGDRIVLADTESDDELQSRGGILSGLSAAFDGILDYIR